MNCVLGSLIVCLLFGSSLCTRDLNEEELIQREKAMRIIDQKLSDLELNSALVELIKDNIPNAKYMSTDQMKQIEAPMVLIFQGSERLQSHFGLMWAMEKENSLDLSLIQRLFLHEVDNLGFEQVKIDIQTPKEEKEKKRVKVRKFLKKIKVNLKKLIACGHPADSEEEKQIREMQPIYQNLLSPVLKVILENIRPSYLIADVAEDMSVTSPHFLAIFSAAASLCGLFIE